MNVTIYWSLIIYIIVLGILVSMYAYVEKRELKFRACEIYYTVIEDLVFRNWQRTIPTKT